MKNNEELIQRLTETLRQPKTGGVFVAVGMNEANEARAVFDFVGDIKVIMSGASAALLQNKVSPDAIRECGEALELLGSTLKLMGTMHELNTKR